MTNTASADKQETADSSLAMVVPQGRDCKSGRPAEHQAMQIGVLAVLAISLNGRAPGAIDPFFIWFA